MPLQIQGYLARPTTAPITVVAQCADGRHQTAMRATVAEEIEDLQQGCASP